MSTIPDAVLALVHAAMYPPTADGMARHLGMPWTAQDLRACKNVPFGLRQKRAGPCGVLAAIQCELVRLYAFGPMAAVTSAASCSNAAKALPASWWNPSAAPSASAYDEAAWHVDDNSRRRLLLLALTGIVWRCLPEIAGEGGRDALLVFAAPPTAGSTASSTVSAGAMAGAGTTVTVRGRAYTFKHTDFTRQLRVLRADSPAALAAAFEAHTSLFTDNDQPSLALLLYSMILTRRVVSSKADLTVIAAVASGSAARESQGATGGAGATAAVDAAATTLVAPTSAATGDSVVSTSDVDASLLVPSDTTIWDDMDHGPLRQAPDPAPSLLGPDQYCENDVVAFFLTGRAVSFVFDGQEDVLQSEWAINETTPSGLPGDTVHRVLGVPYRPVSGLFSFDEAKIALANPHFAVNRLTKVGAHFKRPQLPIWVVHFNDHYYTAFVPPASMATALRTAKDAGMRCINTAGEGPYEPDAGQFAGVAALDGSAALWDVLIYDQLGSEDVKAVTCLAGDAGAGGALIAGTVGDGHAADYLPAGSAVPASLTHFQALTCALTSVWPGLEMALPAAGFSDWQVDYPMFPTADKSKAFKVDRQLLLL